MRSSHASAARCGDGGGNPSEDEPAPGLVLPADRAKQLETQLQVLLESMKEVHLAGEGARQRARKTTTTASSSSSSSSGGKKKKKKKKKGGGTPTPAPPAAAVAAPLPPLPKVRDVDDLVDLVARASGGAGKHPEERTRRACAYVLAKWRAGDLGRYTLDHVK